MKYESKDAWNDGQQHNEGHSCTYIVEVDDLTNEIKASHPLEAESYAHSMSLSTVSSRCSCVRIHKHR